MDDFGQRTGLVACGRNAFHQFPGAPNLEKEEGTLVRELLPTRSDQFLHGCRQTTSSEAVGLCVEQIDRRGVQTWIVVLRRRRYRNWDGTPIPGRLRPGARRTQSGSRSG